MIPREKQRDVFGRSVFLEKRNLEDAGASFAEADEGKSAMSNGNHKKVFVFLN